MICSHQDDLLQVFNRGGFSAGHLKNSPNTDFVYPEKPNNAGIYIGNISNYSAHKGYVSFTLKNKLLIHEKRLKKFYLKKKKQLWMLFK